MNAEAVGLTDAQKELRRSFTGGSEIAAVVGLNPFMSAIDVYLNKVDGFEPEPNEHMDRGTFLEDGIANWYAATRTPCKYAPPIGTVRHATNPRAGCTPDRLVQFDAGFRDLSIKAPGPQFGRDTWGAEGSDDVPLQYLIQLQWELGILTSLGFPLVDEHHIAALLDGLLRVFVVRFDPELFADLLERNDAFWRDYIEKGEFPPVDGSASAARYLDRKFKAREPLRPATLRETAMALELMEAESVARAVGERLRLAQNRLKESIGNAAGIEGPFGRVTWRTDKRGVRSFKTQWNEE